MAAPLIGRTILHYRVVRLLGSGGMGVVYEAEDLKLHRVVALKFLPPKLAADPTALERLQREARAASNLNHPNICTVYAIEQADTPEGPRHFFAMERLDGQPLDQMLRGKPLPVDVALEIGIQVADALDAAHARGIIHRDIKPANIFVQPRHHVKLLDFGLAKAAAARVGMTETALADGRADVLTSPGTTLGTVAYMSPEQARGEDLDARTDLFSFGAVLYEMCAGRPPFTGKTSAVIFQKILDKDPEPLAAGHPALPPRLEEIVSKALEKNRDLRCQTAAELRADLKRLQRDATSGRLMPTHVAESGRSPAAVSSAPASSGAVLLAEAKRRPLALVIALIVLAAAGYGAYRLLTGNESGQRTQPLSITPVTRTGDIAGCTSTSPDGKLIVYCDRDRKTGALTLWVHQVATRVRIKLTDGGGAPTFSLDGNFLYIRRADTDKDNLEGALYVMPALGGEEPRRVLTRISGPVTLSPDGKQIAFLRGAAPFEESIIIASRDGSTERTVYAADRQASMTPVAWWPKGGVIATSHRDSSRGLMAPVVVDIASGKLTWLTDQRWSAVHRVVWLHDGTGLVFSATQPGETENQLWLISYPDGRVTRITNDLHHYASTSFGVSADDTIAIGQYVNAGDVSVSDPTGGNPIRVTGGSSLDSVIGWAGNGRLAYRSAAPARSLWTWSPGSASGSPRTAPVDLTDIGGMFMAPGRDWIVYTNPGARPDIDIWRVNLDGTGRQQLTRTGHNVNPRVTPDGEWILYANWESGVPDTWKVPAAGGTPVLLNKRTGAPTPAPDSQRYMAVMVPDDPLQQASPLWAIGIFRLADGALERTLKLPKQTPQFVREGRPQWVTDRSLVYSQTQGNVGNLWELPLDGSAPRQLTRFDKDLIFSYAYSPDGKLLATARGSVNGDLVLIRNFR